MDRFTGTSGTQLASHSPDYGPAWTLLSTGASRLTLDGNGGVFPTAAAPANGILYTLATPMPTADYSAIAVLEQLTAVTTVVGVVVRATAADTYYLGGYSTAANAWKITKLVGGVATDLSSVPTAFAVGAQHQVQLTVAGTTLTLYVDGVQIATTTDASIAGPGSAGLATFNNAANVAGTGLHAAQWQAVY